MNRGLKSELALALGALALFSYRKKNPLPSLAFAAGAGALLWAGKKPNRSFFGQSVVVTGGSRGLGLALAGELVREGALVALLARDTDELEKARQQILRHFPDGHVLVLTCDVTQEGDVKNAVARIAKQFGGIDMVINNAGAITVGPYTRMTAQDFSAQLDLHFFAAMNVINQSLPYLRRSRGRRIVNICSMGGKLAVPHMLPYDVSKFALAAYSQGLGAELAGDSISITTVYPALMRTGSPIQAVFKGDHEKEFAWFAALDLLPGFSSSARSMARKIINGARHRHSEMVPSIPGKLGIWLGAVFPELLAATMRAVAALLPRGESAEYKTGAQSRALFDRSSLTAPFRQAGAVIENDLNQVPKYDAEFNMGLKKLH